MHRRVPQIVGVYIGALWLAIEIAEWLTGQAGWPSVFGLYLFVFLIALLPAVILVAWRHGAPGRDEWGGMEKIGVPANAVLAAVLVMLVVEIRPPTGEQPTESAQPAVVERTLIDETGQAQVFQVARKGFGISAVTLFWPRSGSSEVAWESYAAPWLLSMRLNPDPLINFGVPFDRTLAERLMTAGFEDGLGEPLSLGLEIASDLGSDYLVRGTYARSEGGYELTAELYEVSSVKLMDRFTASGESLIEAVDALGAQLAEPLVGDLDRGTAEFRPIGLAESTTDNEAVLEPFIRGVKGATFNSDFEAAQAALTEAVTLDPSFAPGWSWLHQVQRQSGDMDGANESIEQALAHDYKLDTEMRFILRANQYAVAGDIERAIRVIRMWTEVQPYSLRAWTGLTRNLLLIGELDEARAANEEARMIDPDRASLDRTRAEIEELAGEYELAAQLLEDYLAVEPSDDAAWISLGGLRERTGDADGAREAYERASFVASNDFAARQRLLRLEGRAGDPETALRDYRRALNSSLPPTEASALASDLITLLNGLGRMQEVIDVIDVHGDVIRQALPPLARALTVDSLVAGAYNSLGQHDRALETLAASEAVIPPPFGALLVVSRIPVYENTGDIDAAKRELAVLRELVESYEMPGQAVGLNSSAARVAAMEGEYESALEFMATARDLLRATTFSLISEFVDPITLQQADYLIGGQRPEEAIDVIDGLLETYPNYGEARLVKARALHENGQADQARVVLSGLLELWSSADSEFIELKKARALAEKWGMALP